MITPQKRQLRTSLAPKASNNILVVFKIKTLTNLLRALENQKELASYNLSYFDELVSKQNLSMALDFDLILFDQQGLQDLHLHGINKSDLPPFILLTDKDSKETFEKSVSSKVSDILYTNELTSTLLAKSFKYTLELHRVQKKLYHQLEGYDQFIENNKLPVLMVDLNTQEILKVNQAAINLYGYTREEFLRLSILDIRPEEDIPRLKKAINEVNADTKNKFQEVFRHLAKDGRILYVDIKSTPIIINDREIRLVLIEDISNELSAQQALAQSERRFKALVQEGMDIIAVISAEAKHLYISPNVERILGFSQEEYMGMNVYDFIHPDDIPQIQQAFEKLIGSKTPLSIGPFRVKNSKGEWRYLESRFTNQLEDTEIRGLVSTSRDVTHEVENQIALQKSKERFENIAQLTNDLVYEYDPFSQQMTIITNGQHDIYDTNVSTSKINRLDWEARMHPQDRDEMLQYLHQMFNGKHRLESVVEYRFQKPDGKYAHVQDSFKTIKGDNETFLIQGSIQDISLRKMHGALLSFEKDMLALYAKDQAGIETLLNKALKTLEDLIDGAMCSVLKLSPNKTIQHLCAPSLPKAYVDGINGLKIGPSVGSCGTAMYFGKTVIVTDIPNDPLWATHADFVSKFNLKACWSVPIRSQTGQVLGSFATYYHSCRKPDYFEMETISRAASVLGIILENFHAREDLKKLNQRYDIVALATSDLIWEYDPSAKKVMIDEVLFKKFGYLREDNYKELKWWINHLHRSERFKVMRNILTNLKDGQSEINHDLLFRAANGEYRQLLTRIFIVRNDKGEITRAIGAMEDITEREKHLKEIERQNAVLKEISWDQSHKVRAPLSRIMGLTELLASGEASKGEFEEILRYLSESSQELDTIVRNIIRKVELMKRQAS